MKYMVVRINMAVCNQLSAPSVLVLYTYNSKAMVQNLVGQS